MFDSRRSLVKEDLKIETNLLLLQMKFTGGQQCWNGPPRSATVVLHCGTQNVLTAVSEPSRYPYTLSLFLFHSVPEGNFISSAVLRIRTLLPDPEFFTTGSESGSPVIWKTINLCNIKKCIIYMWFVDFWIWIYSDGWRTCWLSLFISPEWFKN